MLKRPLMGQRNELRSGLRTGPTPRFMPGLRLGLMWGFIPACLAVSLLGLPSPALAQNNFTVSQESQQSFDTALYSALKASFPDLQLGGAGASLPANDSRPNIQISSQWKWSPLRLSGPNQDDSGNYKLALEADVIGRVTLEPDGGEAVEHSHAWTISRAIPIANIDQLLALVEQATGNKPDLSDPEQKKQVIAVLEQVQTFQNMLSNSPASTLAQEAQQEINATTLTILSEKIVKSVQALNSEPEAQPSSNGEQLGLTIGLRGGTVPFMENMPGAFGIDFSKYFVPHFQLDIEYDLGGLTGLENLSATLHGGSTLPVGISPPGSFPGSFPTANAMGINGEAGLMYRWPFGDFDFHLGLRGGILYGLLNQTQQQFGQFPQPPSSDLGFGGTLITGFQWNISPSFALGLDLGGRYFAGSFWFPVPQQQVFPMSSVGPVIQLYTSYTI